MLLDEVQFNDLVGGDAESFQCILDDFEQNGLKLLEDISQAYRQNDAALKTSAAHQLKGSSGMLGMNLLYEECKELEHAELQAWSESRLEKMSRLFQESLAAARDELK